MNRVARTRALFGFLDDRDLVLDALVVDGRRRGDREVVIDTDSVPIEDAEVVAGAGITGVAGLFV